MAFRFLFEVLFRARLGKGKTTSKWLDYLGGLLIHHTPSAVWMGQHVGAHPNQVLQVLLQHPEAEYREGCATLLAKVALHLARFEIDASVPSQLLKAPVNKSLAATGSLVVAAALAEDAPSASMEPVVKVEVAAISSNDVRELPVPPAGVFIAEVEKPENLKATALVGNLEGITAAVSKKLKECGIKTISELANLFDTAVLQKLHRQSVHFFVNFFFFLFFEWSRILISRRVGVRDCN